MKRVVTAMIFVVAMGLAVMAQAQDANLLMLSKNFNGAITKSSVEIGLSANADCDQTKSFIPDGSKLMTQSFALNADSNGVGTFSGTAYIVTPAGRVVLSGTLKGTVGINTRCGASRNCRLPWHLEGLFESTPSSSERSIVRAASDVKIAPMVLNFSGDLNPQTASPLPIYQGRLDGLVPSLPAAVDRISMAQDKPSYLLTDTIFTTIVNDSPETIQTWDKRSCCSIAVLQVLNGNQWDDTAFCPFRSASLPVYIAPGSKFEIQMNLTLTLEPLKPGVYRVALPFKFVSGNIPLSDNFVITTQQFRLAAQPPSNQVIFNLDKQAYEEKEAVFVKINNDTSQSVIAYNHQSFCSVVTLQRRNGNEWESIFPCLLATPTIPVKIASREEIEFKLPTDTTNTVLSVGTYRVAFSYFTSTDASGNPTGNATTIYTQTFSVAAK